MPPKSRLLKSRFTKLEQRQLEVLKKDIDNASLRLIAFAKSLVENKRQPEFLGSIKYPRWRSFLKWAIRAAEQRCPLPVMMGNQLMHALRSLGLECEEPCKKYMTLDLKHHYLAFKYSDYLLSDVKA